MFLGSGDGLVFRGAVGPWYSETRDAYHLDQDQAAKLMEMIVRSYTDIHGSPPTELFHPRQDQLRLERMGGLLECRAPHNEIGRRADPRHGRRQALPLRRERSPARDR